MDKPGPPAGRFGATRSGAALAADLQRWVTGDGMLEPAPRDSQRGWNPGRLR